jgi:uncharacterized NAD(P)/FAD-binding protein YdhS
MPSSSPIVAVVGGGAIGVALVGALVERLSSRAWARGRPRIAIFEKAEEIGRGVAYARDAAPYLLNTSAQAMSLVPGRRRDFLDWLERRGLATGEEDCPCERRVFGDFVAESFAATLERAARAGIGVTTIRDEVTALVPRPSGGHRVAGRGSEGVDADAVVLAVGNLPGTRFRALAGPAFFASPYPSASFAGRIPAGARVAILGTGLSAIDAALALFAAGHEGPVTMASRSGMLPAVRGPLPEIELGHVTRANVARETEGGQRTLRLATVLSWLTMELARLGASVSWDRDFPAWAPPIERLSAEIAAAAGGVRAWQAVGEALNPMIEVVWHHLADDDRRLFLGRYRSRFMSHWVPIPIGTARRILDLLRARRLTAERGLGDVERRGDGFALRIGDRSEAFDAVIDATGAPRYLHETESPLLDDLRERGAIVAHPHGGVRVEVGSLRALREGGRPDPALYAVGNLTSGAHLFTSTLELNVERAFRLAAHLVEELHGRREKDLHVDAAPHPS